MPLSASTRTIGSLTRSTQQGRTNAPRAFKIGGAPSDITFSQGDVILGRKSVGAGAGQEIDCTAFARTILDDADGPTVRATIGAIGGSGTLNTLAKFSPDTTNIDDSIISDDGATATVTGALDVTGAATVGTTLGVTGATTLSSTLGVTGATTLSSTLDVTGATTLSSTLGVTGAATLSSTLGVTGATTLSSTLGVTGATTLSSTLSVTSWADVAGDFVRVQGSGNPAAGEGLELRYSSASSKGLIIGYDRAGAAYKGIDINAGPVVIKHSGTTVLTTAATSATFGSAMDVMMTGGKYIYLRGTASTNGSVRISSSANFTFLIETRIAGSWVTLWEASAT